MMSDMTEDNARLQAVVSLLSAGPVAISDRINHTDLDLIHRSVLYCTVYNQYGMHVLYRSLMYNLSCFVFVGRVFMLLGSLTRHVGCTIPSIRNQLMDRKV